MSIRVLSPEATLRALELAQSSYRPRQIVELQERIDGDTRRLQLRLDCGQSVDDEDARAVVQMKLELDGLYADWAEGKIS